MEKQSSEIHINNPCCYYSPISFSAVAADNITVYTYDSFAADWGPRPAVEKAFEKVMAVMWILSR